MKNLRRDTETRFNVDGSHLLTAFYTCPTFDCIDDFSVYLVIIAGRMEI